jgi:hypothetical protein
LIPLGFGILVSVLVIWYRKKKYNNWFFWYNVQNILTSMFERKNNCV